MSIDRKAVGDALSYFAGRNDAEMIKRLVSLGASPDEPNSFGTNALIVAIGGDSLAAASALVAAGANPKAWTVRGAPLDYAGKVGSIEMKGLLDGKVPDAGARLRSAARVGDLQAIGELAKSGADLNSNDEQGVTPILEAAQAGSRGAVDALLKLGANPDGSPKAQVTPLAVAVVLGDTVMAKTLLDAHAYPDMKVQGVPTLTLAVAAGRKEIIDLLLAAKADKGIKGTDGMRPADIAAAMGQPSLAEELGGPSAFKPAIDLFAAIKAKDGDRVKADLSNGADPNQKNKEGYPALVYACAFGNDASVDNLLQAGADPLAVGPDGVSALVAANARQDTETNSVEKALFEHVQPGVVQQLLTLKDGHGRSAAVALAAHGKSGFPNPYADAITTSMSKTAAAQLANSPDEDGITPLEAAVIADNDIIVRGFVFAGAVPGMVKGNMSLQDLARARGSWRAFAQLPSDRVLPDGLEEGASDSVKQEFQSLLSRWGYYKGKTDGNFGKTSKASAVAFFKDRGKEMRQVADNSGAVSRIDHPGANPGETTLKISWQGEGDKCDWIVENWSPHLDSAVSFIGCVRGNSTNWNANGIGYVAYGDGREQILLFGDGGWDDYIELQ